MVFFDAMEDYYSHRVEYNVTEKLFSGLDSWNQTNEYLSPILNKNNTFSEFMYSERAVDILKNHDKSKPFFLYFAAQTPHVDHKFNCPKKYSDLYLHIDNEKRRKILGLISLLDETVGNLTKVLNEKGLTDNTLIYFMSDNGAETYAAGRNYPLRGGKRTVFEGGHRVRAFVNGKGLKPLKYSGMFHSVDLLPTMMSSALNRPIEFSGIDGVNQWDAITNNLNSRRETFIYNIDPIGNLGCSKFTEAIRDADWKLIKGCPGIYTDWYNLTEFDLNKYHEYHGINMSISYESASCVDDKPAKFSYFLFNINDDPWEEVNLAEKFPCKVRDLEVKINKYKDESVEPLVSKPPFFDPKSDPGKFGDKWSPGWC